MMTDLVPNELLQTVPQHDYLDLFSGNTAKKVVDFLEFDRYQVAKAMGLEDKTQVRFDNQIRRDLKERLEEIAVICELMAGYFHGDVKKTALWFRIKNPALGGISPRDMIRYGRYKKLALFIRNALEGMHP
ncbi:MAG TPA: hypothetical protein VNC84_03615 [Gammaproteobacteria bacterium]|nr:hypothetical protein [Gammaproteobacteria bacterium]